MKFLFLIGAVLAIAGCVASPVMITTVPEQLDGQEIVYVQGKKTAVQKKTALVGLAAYKEINPTGTNTSFVIYVENHHSTHKNIGAENVRVVFRSSNPAWNNKELKVYAYPEMLALAQREAADQLQRAKVGAIAGAFNAYAASTSTSTTYQSGTVGGNYNSNSYGTFGGAAYSGNTNGAYSGQYSGYSTTTTHDPAKAQALANQNASLYAAQANAINQAASSNLQFIETYYLKMQTVPANHSYTGFVTVDTEYLPYDATGFFDIEVKVGDEPFMFTVSRIRQPTQ